MIFLFSLSYDLQKLVYVDACGLSIWYSKHVFIYSCGVTTWYSLLVLALGLGRCSCSAGKGDIKCRKGGAKYEVTMACKIISSNIPFGYVWNLDILRENEGK